MTRVPPSPEGATGLRALRALLSNRSIMSALESLHAELGDVFRIPLPGFNPVMLVGAEANRFVLVENRDELRWRSEQDPVTKLLRQGVLVVDGEFHDRLRQRMNPALHRRMFASYVETMWRTTSNISASWSEAGPLDMLVEMRRISLLNLIETLFGVDFSPEMRRLWPSILRTLKYIAPGTWLVWRGVPRPGYRRLLRQLDQYLYQIISERRQTARESDDLLGILVRTPGLSDDLIRDQLLTMLIAGHDTSTALLAWCLYLIGERPEVLQRIQAEIDAKLGAGPAVLESLNRLEYLESVIKETLRLYPPIHIGNRVAATDLVFRGFRIPAGTRVLYSTYLTHRHKDYWPEPHSFQPERFGGDGSRGQEPYAFVPFGGGPRNCIGAAYALVEAKVVLACVFQHFDLELLSKGVRVHMGATLEPRPGVMMRAKRRSDHRKMPKQR